METIPFNKELAKKLQEALWEHIHMYVSHDYGTDQYVCTFCGTFKYYNSKDPLKHYESCLGVALEKELNERLGNG